MLLKKENKLLFQSNESIDKHKRTSSSASKRSLIKMPSTSKLPHDFFSCNDPIKMIKAVEKKNSRDANFLVTDSLLFTFKAKDSEKLH